MEDFIGKYNGGQIESRLDKVKDMVGATASQAGEDGLVPAPAKGDEGRFLCGDGTWKDVVVKPDYTVFDIVMEIASSDNPSISQENYNKLLEKLPSNAVNIFPVRDNGVYISSLLGGYNVNGDNAIWFRLELNNGVLQNNSAQIYIYQDLTVSVDSGMNYLIPVSDGIDVYTNLVSGLSENNTKQLTIHTTGDGTKSLMDDGKYRIWLFAVEYATLDSQKPFNAQKDANGFAQGGLGPGPTQMTDWTNFNNTNPLIPCGYTNEFGNGSGEKAYVVNNASGGTHAKLGILDSSYIESYKVFLNDRKSLKERVDGDFLDWENS